MNKKDIELKINYNKDGLIPCITIDIEKKNVLMLACMNKESLLLTLEKNYMYYWSRSRNKLWLKGETSGNKQKLIEMFIDCDDDSLLAFVELENKKISCHTGQYSCFHTKLEFKDNKMLKNIGV